MIILMKFAEKYHMFQKRHLYVQIAYREIGVRSPADRLVNCMLSAEYHNNELKLNLVHEV